ncbi:MAG: transposase [Cyanobacteria bacterium SBLK]|nr:transposase [Cyanobacteria bacterium SBLK]
MLIDYPPDIALSKFIANLKTVTSRLIRGDFRGHIQQFHRKEAFWTGAYFVASTGGVTLAQLKKYIQSQDAPSAR